VKWGFVKLADVDDAVLGEDAGEHAEEVQLAGVEGRAPLESVEGSASRFTVAPSERAATCGTHIP
jgi:hypothetical protein